MNELFIIHNYNAIEIKYSLKMYLRTACSRYRPPPSHPITQKGGALIHFPRKKAQLNNKNIT